jgi:hypothetical protein
MYAFFAAACGSRLLVQRCTSISAAVHVAVAVQQRSNAHAANVGAAVLQDKV